MPDCAPYQSSPEAPIRVDFPSQLLLQRLELSHEMCRSLSFLYVCEQPSAFMDCTGPAMDARCKPRPPAPCKRNSEAPSESSSREGDPNSEAKN
ncbi:hypothetical protein NDU88_008507 [Pleurodeles waltl]|uniref:Uncharacterized protein n=1 Tax=Pleurodeles waltl TaxID=8319 RepID=A0AAV7NEH0_PLEWA|nr:hypothetical protein NDU88_008507 [Pleurodeles waltl]